MVSSYKVELKSITNLLQATSLHMTQCNFTFSYVADWYKPLPSTAPSPNKFHNFCISHIVVAMLVDIYKGNFITENAGFVSIVKIIWYSDDCIRWRNLIIFWHEIPTLNRIIGAKGVISVYRSIGKGKQRWDKFWHMCLM